MCIFDKRFREVPYDLLNSRIVDANIERTTFYVLCAMLEKQSEMDAAMLHY